MFDHRQTKMLIELFVIFLLKFTNVVEGLNCTNLCCYKYQALIVSVNVTKCNPDGFNLELLCAVYWPKAIEPFTELTVNWYKSKEQPDLLAGLEGEMIENTTHKYVLTVTQPTVEDYETQSTIGSDTVNSQYFSLGIINFTTDDSGYYWCQMIVNSSCLKPSAYRHIATNTSISRSCSYYDNSYDHLDQSKKFCGNASSSCNAIKHKASDNTTKDSTCFSSKTFYSISGILLLIIVLLLLVIMALCASCFSHKKRTVMPYISNDESESAPLWPSSTASGVKFNKVDTPVDELYENRESVTGDNTSASSRSLSTVRVDESTINSTAL